MATERLGEPFDVPPTALTEQRDGALASPGGAVGERTGDDVGGQRAEPMPSARVDVHELDDGRCE